MRSEPGEKPSVAIYYEGTNLGGVSSVIEMVTCASAENFSTVVISRNSASLKEWYEAFRGRNIEVITTALRNRFDLFGWLDVFNLFKSLRVIHKTKVLHCHLHTTFSCIPIIILARILTKARIITTEHYVTQLKFLRRRKLSLIGSLVRETKIATLMLLKRISFRFIDKIVTVAESNRVFMIETFGQKIEAKLTVIANGIDTSQYTGAGKIAGDHDTGHHDDVQTVVVVAGLNNQKGHEFLFRAIPEVLSYHPRARFLMVGDGHLRSYLENLARELGVYDSMEFLGFRSDVAKILKRSDLFVLPSLFEGLPLSLLEAMAAAKAVVATDVDGTADVVIDNETGFLVPPRNSEELARKIMVLLGEPGLRHKFGVAGRARVVNFFSDVRMANGYEQLYLELI